jgi:hypothetical protein
MSIIINDEWELTRDSLQGKGPISYYWIAASRLTETINEVTGPVYIWPVHIAAKMNFDYSKFVEAYRRALSHFAGKYKPPLDAAKLEKSIALGAVRDVEKRISQRIGLKTKQAA